MNYNKLNEFSLIKLQFLGKTYKDLKQRSINSCNSYQNL